MICLISQNDLNHATQRTSQLFSVKHCFNNLYLICYRILRKFDTLCKILQHGSHKEIVITEATVFLLPKVYDRKGKSSQVLQLMQCRFCSIEYQGL